MKNGSIVCWIIIQQLVNALIISDTNFYRYQNGRAFGAAQSYNHYPTGAFIFLSIDSPLTRDNGIQQEKIL
jgi:hypothetical protein